ncbi:MarR family winged helix-turn-helix transcriptional regulator [Streptomyces radicis]|uniref:MarR family transcriptional regulator n=1 Tax=Streptomyces radicis TaxID=1750517 RepID=A0A3A9WN38_9ACTN|nr:MarR family transcriptional regulator [Streptomyces radicis]RKN07587.1 MarR family transcriptional regulator [Streptomyces radicis]RKN18310.1 MarR family transcriptional regulator [Streptomyces radicis]
MTPETSTASPAASPAAAPPARSRPEPRHAALLDTLQHEVAVFARRAEQTRLGGLGPARETMDRAAYLLLSRLAEEGPAGVKALACGMGIDSSTVTRQVAPLVAAGLVRRAADPADGRAVVLQLSPLGSERLAEVRDSRRRLISELTEGWTPEERADFCALLTRFNGAITRLQSGGPDARGASEPVSPAPG